MLLKYIYNLPYSLKLSDIKVLFDLRALNVNWFRAPAAHTHFPCRYSKDDK